MNNLHFKTFICVVEAGLGFRLFERMHRSLALTKAGESLYQDAKYITEYCRERISIFSWCALALMKEYEVTLEAWGPFAEGKHGIFTNPILTEIGEKYGKSAAQVVLRWNTQRGVVVIPKTVHRNRMEQNIDIWDFKLTDEEMEVTKPLDIGHGEIVNHFDPNFVKMLHGRFLK